MGHLVPGTVGQEQSKRPKWLGFEIGFDLAWSYHISATVQQYHRQAPPAILATPVNSEWADRSARGRARIAATRRRDSPDAGRSAASPGRGNSVLPSPPG